MVDGKVGIVTGGAAGRRGEAPRRVAGGGRRTARRPHRRADSGRVPQGHALLASLAVAFLSAALSVASLAGAFRGKAQVAEPALVGIASTVGASGGDALRGDGGQPSLGAYDEPDIAGTCPVVWIPQDDGSFVNTDGAWLAADNLFGVDVSEHNGWVDWETAKACGVDFAMIRCGYGSDDAYFDDECWEYNASECERLGIPYGVYLFSYTTTVDGVYSEAAHTIRLLDGHHPTMGVWYDVEDGDQMATLDYDPETFAVFMNIFADEVESATGCETGIYASASWFSSHLSEIAWRGEHPIWVACWTDDAPNGIDYQCWQAGAALIPGFACQVDFNVIEA